MEAFIGQVQLFGFGFAPKGWLQCNGQLLKISDNQPLYSLLGTTYGGNGVETFAIPKLAPLAAQGPAYFICVSSGEYPTRSA